MADEELEALELLPADDEGIEPEDDLAAAEASALDDEPEEAPEDVVEPFGSSWHFNFETGRFYRSGLEPKRVSGRDALAVWCDTVMHTARWAHPIFSAEFGMEEPEDIIGEATDAAVIASDWLARLREALMVHDRIVGVEHIDAHYHPDEGILHVHELTVITDEPADAPLRFQDVILGSLGQDS